MSKNKTRALLMAVRPAVTPLNLPERFPPLFVRQSTVGSVNYELDHHRTRQIKLAEQQGIALDHDDEEHLLKQLGQVFDPHEQARTIAHRLSDEDGVLLFDVNSESDLDAINTLESELLRAIWLALKQENTPKNPAPGDASSSS